MNYIERQRRGEFFNPVSGTVEINPDSDGSGNKTPAENEQDQNLARWKWLIDGWASMTFLEKIALLSEYYHYINLRNVKKEDFDDALNGEIARLQFEYCRTLKGIKFDPDGQGIPNIIVVFNPVDPFSIPDAALGIEIFEWGVNHGFIKNPNTPPAPPPCPCPYYDGKIPGALGTQEGCCCTKD